MFDNHGGGKNRRATQALFMTGDHTQRPAWVDQSNYVPFGEVIAGMDIIDAIHQHAGMEDIAQVFLQGNGVLRKVDPYYSQIKTVRISQPAGV
jgi:cyclophilin family peptidyl-prolyl cis-trans isomerase